MQPGVHNAFKMTNLSERRTADKSTISPVG